MGRKPQNIKQAHYPPPSGRQPRMSAPPTPAPPPPLAVSKAVDGMVVARRQIFQAPLTAHAWWLDMLVSIEAAKQLGVQTFEVVTSGALTREKPRDPNTYTFMNIISGDDWRGSGSRTESGTITVYAVVVE
jgi:hypothetical protein